MLVEFCIPQQRGLLRVVDISALLFYFCLSHPPGTRYRHACKCLRTFFVSLSRYSEWGMRGWSVLGSVLLMGSGALVRVSSWLAG